MRLTVPTCRCPPSRQDAAAATSGATGRIARRNVVGPGSTINCYASTGERSVFVRSFRPFQRMETAELVPVSLLSVSRSHHGDQFA